MLLPFSLVFDGVWVWGLATSDLVLCFLFLQDCPCQFFLVRIPSSGSLKCIPSCSSQYRHGLGLPPRVLLTLPGQPLEDTALSGTAPGYPGRAGVLAQVLIRGGRRRERRKTDLLSGCGAGKAQGREIPVSAGR